MARRIKWRLPEGAWKDACAVVLRRSNGNCENCGLRIEFVRSSLRYTDQIMWSVHHIVPRRELRKQAKDLCKALSGEAHKKCVRMVFVKLATDPNNLELRCHRRKCRGH